MSPLLAFILGLGCSAALFAVALKHAVRVGVVQGAKHMLEVVDGQQRYCYRELAGEPNSEVMLRTVDAMAAGARAAYLELEKEARE